MEKRTFTITLTQIAGEPDIVFLDRARRVVEFVMQQHKDLATPTTIDFSDPGVFRKAGDSANEAITPGYEQEENGGV